ncbi:MAG: EamA family transporter, partial [Candidatus Saccharibacteria bacterium]|nr:EamA family transporter [Candidatus Saccharibacteria bacterium]
MVLYFALSVTNTLFSRWFMQRNKLSSKLTSAMSYGLGVLPVGILIGISGNERIFSWHISTLLLLTIITLFIALFGWASFEAKRLISVTLFLTLFQIYVFVTVLLGWVFLGENLGIKQITGGVLLIIGAYLAIYSEKREKYHKKPLRGVVLATLSGIALGIVLVAEKSTLNSMNLSAYFIIGYGVQALGTIILASKEI